MHECYKQKTTRATWLQSLRNQMPEAELILVSQIKKHFVTRWTLRNSDGDFAVQPDFALILPSHVGIETMIVAGEFVKRGNGRISDSQLTAYTDTMIDGVIQIGTHCGGPDRWYARANGNHLDSPLQIQKEFQNLGLLVSWFRRFQDHY